MVFTIIAVLVIVLLVGYLLIMKKKKTSEPTKATTEQVNVSYGMDTLTKNIVAEPASVPVAQVPEVESNLGAEMAVVTPETAVPKKKRAPRKKKEA